MTNQQGQHYSQDELLSYVYENLPEWEAISLEKHLSVCTSCLQRVRELQRVESIWGSFSTLDWDVVELTETAAAAEHGAEGKVEIEESVAAVVRKAGLKLWAGARLVYIAQEHATKALTEGFKKHLVVESPFSGFELLPRPAGALLMAGGLVRTRGVVGTSARGPAGQRLLLNVDEGTGKVTATFADPAMATPPPKLLVFYGGAEPELKEVKWTRDEDGVWSTPIGNVHDCGEGGLAVAVCG